jgi:hypothetical protein
MPDFSPEARVTGEAARVGLQVAGVREAGAIVSDFGQHPGGKLDTEARQAEDNFGGVRIL